MFGLCEREKKKTNIMSVKRFLFLKTKVRKLLMRVVFLGPRES